MNLKIVAELPMAIHHTFVTKAEKLADITHIYSKDIAFRQCAKFLNEYFENHPVQLIPVESTSKAARIASQEPHVAAICSQIAAKLFGVPVLFRNIEDSDSNRTRFLIISKDIKNARSTNDKTTIVVNLDDKPGSLARFLQLFDEKNINLTKIESRPLRGGEQFRSWFYIDFDGHIDDADVQEIIGAYPGQVKWAGSYVKLT
jgi:chorismate mutase/prephenate dehydratase